MHCLFGPSCLKALSSYISRMYFKYQFLVDCELWVKIFNIYFFYKNLSACLFQWHLSKWKIVVLTVKIGWEKVILIVEDENSVKIRDLSKRMFLIYKNTWN